MMGQMPSNPQLTDLSMASTSKQNLFSIESVFLLVHDLRVKLSSSPWQREKINKDKVLILMLQGKHMVCKPTALHTAKWEESKNKILTKILIIKTHSRSSHVGEIIKLHMICPTGSILYWDHLDKHLQCTEEGLWQKKKSLQEVNKESNF